MDTKYENSFRDEQLICADCRAEFVFTAGEARFYASKQLIAPPRRCPECRRLRRATINRDGANSPDPTRRWRNLYPPSYGGMGRR